jgi:hypothetical protein
MASPLRRFAATAPRHRLARALLVAGLLGLALVTWRAAPRDTSIEYALGGSHRELVELRVAYLLDGEELSGARFDFPGGAPARVAHRPTLPPGELEVRIEATSRDGRNHRSTRRLTTPAEGAVTLGLEGERP